MSDLDVWQFGGQGIALGRAFGARGRFGANQAFEFDFDGGDVGIDHFFQQTDLQHVEVSAALTELVTLEQRQFMGQLLIDLLAVAQAFCSTGDISIVASWRS